MAPIPIPGDTNSSGTVASPSSARMNGVLFLLMLSVLINYIDRSNLSIAAPLLKDELGLTGSQLGVLLAGFFWTYALLQIPAGWLVDRFDVKWVFALGFLVWSAATAVTAALHGFLALLAIRVVLGVGESIAFPSYGKILGGYFAESRRGVANSIITAGLALGPALGMLVGGTAVARFGWRPFFLALGLIGALWLAPWWACMPRRRPDLAGATKAGGILDVLREKSAWGTCICQFSFNYASYFLVTWLPFYLVRERHRSLDQMARIGGFVYLMFAISSLVVGKLTDRWIAGGASFDIRKKLSAAGKICMGIFLVLSAIAPDSLYVWTLSLVGVSMGLAACNIWAVSQTIAGPRMVGRWIGVQNFGGNLAGAVAPWLTGSLLDLTGHFRWAFFITAAITWIGAWSWMNVVGPVREVDWSATGSLATAPRVREPVQP